jgi:pimeloyl-ACP methyl ester carboxylesterase
VDAKAPALSGGTAEGEHFLARRFEVQTEGTGQDGVPVFRSIFRGRKREDKVLPGAGHYPMNETPKALADAIEDFLRH